MHHASAIDDYEFIQLHGEEKHVFRDMHTSFKFLSCVYDCVYSLVAFWNLCNGILTLLSSVLQSFIQVPVDLVIDHSVQVDVARSENAVQANMDHEFRRNKERFAFLKWGSTAFRNMLVVPPGSGIVHQVHIASILMLLYFGTYTKWILAWDCRFLLEYLDERWM